MHYKVWPVLRSGGSSGVSGGWGGSNEPPLEPKFLAHLSWRLTRWAYSIPMVRRLSVFRRLSSVVVHTFKLEYLWSQLANLDQILCVAILGWGKGCIRFWGRLDQNSGFHGNRKPLLTYNGENDVSTFLAHLSQRLTRWAYSIPMVRLLSVVVVCHPHFQTWISLRPVGQSWSNFMCSITGVGERLHKVLGQIG